MSISQYQNSVNSLDREINTLETKKNAADKRMSDLYSKITSAERDISKSKSESTIKSKLRQIEGWKQEYARKQKESADLGTRIANKRSNRSDAYLRLQKEQQNEQKKREKENDKLLATYQKRIDDLQEQLMDKVSSTSHGTLFTIGDEEYDVFVSHAYEDKESFVDEFVNELKNQELKVWYDDDNLDWGDSMREKIDIGLSKSKYGVVVLSPNYIAEHKYWTKAELNGLFQLETFNGKTILPIWHNLTKQQLVNYSPIIADRKALTTAIMTPHEIADELKNLFVNATRDENN